jgi:hypothetical protein
MEFCREATKVTVRINECEAITALEVLERHCFEQCRFACAGLADDVDMGKAIFVFDAEQPIIISKIHSANVYDLISVHRSIVFAIDTIARVLPRSDFLIWRSRRQR